MASTAQPLRGFTDDGEDVPTAKRQTAQQKVNFLELMLGQIANYCPVISRNTGEEFDLNTVHLEQDT